MISQKLNVLGIDVEVVADESRQPITFIQTGAESGALMAGGLHLAECGKKQLGILATPGSGNAKVTVDGYVLGQPVYLQNGSKIRAN